MSEVFEILMIVSFGISWPINVMKSIRTKSTKGKSIFFNNDFFGIYFWNNIKTYGTRIQMVCCNILYIQSYNGRV